MNFSKYDYRNHEEAIRKTIEKFYSIETQKDKIILYSFLDTNFQKQVPLNLFLVHPKYDIDIGNLLEIKEVNVDKPNNLAKAKLLIEEGSTKRIIDVNLKMDFGGWKFSSSFLRR